MSILSEIIAKTNEKIVKESLFEMINDEKITKEEYDGANKLYVKIRSKGLFSE